MDLTALPFVTCPTCRGGGCITCPDVGVFLPFGDRMLTWRREISEDTFARESLARAFEYKVAITLGAIAIVGLGLHVIATFLGASLVAPFTSESPLYILFWISVLAGCAWVARTVERKTRTAALPPGAPGAPRTYEDVARLDPSAFLDIARFASADTLGVLDAAYVQARAGRDPSITPLHLLYALFRSREALFLLVRLGVDVGQLSTTVNTIVTQRTAATETDAAPVVAPAVWKVVFAAYALAAAERHPLVEVRHVIRALFELEEDVRVLLFDRGVDREMVDHVLEWLTSHEQMREMLLRFSKRARVKPRTTMNRALTARPTPLLDQLSEEFTLAARAGLFPPLLDRAEEFARMVEVLARGGSVLLVGEPGVGKSALLKGLAQHMVSEDVPAELQDKRLALVDVARVFAEGAGGVAEARIARLITEVVRAGNVLLAVEDLPNLLGAKGEGTEVDLSDVLTQAMDLPRFQLVATTTVEDDNHILQRYPAVLRRMERVPIAEPDARTTILIAQAKASEFEYRLGVLFTYAAVQFAVEGAQRYLVSERLPASALKILENAAVAVRETRGSGSVVGREDVAAVLSRMTSIPLTRVTPGEQERLLNLEAVLHERLVDQDEAVRAVADALRRARTQLRDPNRPIVTLLFLGPTGVGKTEMAKQIARVEFGEVGAMVRVDMTEYQRLEDLPRLIGTPERGGFLTDAVRNRPYCVVLLDEFEKAHQDVRNVFLQVMDDGRLTDGRGRLVSFTNAIIVATTNAGTDLLTAELAAGRTIADVQAQMVREVLPQHFRPELLNRFDGVILFRPLSFEHVLAIARLLLGEVSARVRQRGVELEVTDEALTDLAKKGDDPLYGARTLRRVIQEDVDAALAKVVLRGDVDRRDRIILEHGGAIRVEKARGVT